MLMAKNTSESSDDEYPQLSDSRKQKIQAGDCEFFIPQGYTISSLLTSNNKLDIAYVMKINSYNCFALTKFKNIFRSKPDALSILKDIKLSRLFKSVFTLKIRDIDLPELLFADLYVFYDYDEANLENLIKSKMQITDELNTYNTFLILLGLNYIHSSGVVHMDICPKNILLNSNSDVKICNFHRSFVLSNDNRLAGEIIKDFTYKAPEQVMKGIEITTSVDMWAVGCVFVEMLIKRPLFKSQIQVEYYEKIVDVLGCPKEDDMFCSSCEVFREVINRSSGKRNRIDEVLCGFKTSVVDLAKSLLQIDPKNRLTAEEALKHVYFQEIYDPSDIEKAEKIKSFEFEYENHNLTEREIKELFIEEILLYHNVDSLKRYNSLINIY